MSREQSALSPPPDTDPFIEREIQKYQRPVPSREFIVMHLAYLDKPVTFNKIAKVLGVKDKATLEALTHRLKAMERDGQLVKNRRQEYGLTKRMNLINGRVIAHPDGYGFLTVDTGGDDLFLPESEMRSLLHGDRILVSTAGIDHRGRRIARLVEVLERNTQEVVGRFFHTKRIAFIEPDNRRIHQDVLIPAGQRGQAKHGQIVVAKLIEQPTKHHPPVGQIVEVIGEHAAPGMETDIAIRSHQVPHSWPSEVLEEAKTFKKVVTEAERVGREDLRSLPFVTIDGEDAKDFDDAVYCEPHGKGWLLRVAIADVAAYVKPQTALDKEAKNRGTSVYFPNRVIPMLPEALSNQLCSLKPQVDRLSMVCELSIDVHGCTRRARFFEAVIRSAARLTYTEVAKVLEGEVKGFRHPKLLPHLTHLQQLYLLLKKRRDKRGAIDFETVETRILFNNHKKIEKIVPVTRNDAHRLIEEMMLAANVATAEWLAKKEMLLLYRIHEAPTQEKITDLRNFLKTLGLSLGGRTIPQAHHYSKLMEKIRERPDMRLIQMVLLRSLRLAVYHPDNQGHFGLAYKAYTHFTSPIRRYPDLLTHRAIKHCLQQKPPTEFLYAYSEMQMLGDHCSMTERRADEAVRDVVSWLKCEYMQDKVGQDYEGLITAVTSFGLFVELDGIFVEGLIHVTALTNDYYHFDPTRQCLYGEHSGNIYRLADKIKVKVMRVDLEERKIDFAPN